MHLEGKGESIYGKKTSEVHFLNSFIMTYSQEKNEVTCED